MGAIHGLKFGDRGLKTDCLLRRELSVRQPPLAQAVKLGVKGRCPSVFLFQTLKIREGELDLRIRDCAQAGEQRSLLVGVVVGRRLAEVAQRRFQ